jgi:hypothetical protein
MALGVVHSKIKRRCEKADEKNGRDGSFILALK